MDQGNKMQRLGNWRLVPGLVIAAIGISGLVEAWPQARESLSDLAIDAAILVAIVMASILLAGLFRKLRPSAP